jgi:branched-subunit amino acid transport protein AzlD
MAFCIVPVSHSHPYAAGAARLCHCPHVPLANGRGGSLTPLGSKQWQRLAWPHDTQPDTAHVRQPLSATTITLSQPLVTAAVSTMAVRYAPFTALIPQLPPKYVRRLKALLCSLSTMLLPSPFTGKAAAVGPLSHRHGSSEIAHLTTSRAPCVGHGDPPYATDALGTAGSPSSSPEHHRTGARPPP